MVTQADIELIETELQQLRTLLMTSRQQVRPRLEALLDKTEQLQAEGRVHATARRLNGRVRVVAAKLRQHCVAGCANGIER